MKYFLHFKLILIVVILLKPEFDETKKPMNFVVKFLTY